VDRTQRADRRRIASCLMEDRCEGTPVHHATLTVRDDAACRRIHGLSTELLTDTGMDMKHEPARELRAAGRASPT